MIIRKATIDDIQDIIEMAKSFHRESDARKYTLTNERIKELTTLIISTGLGILAVKDGEAIGMMGAMLQKNVFFDELMAGDYLIYVKPEYRGTEAAQLMVDYYISWAKSYGATCIGIDIESGINDERAINFYNKMGFRVTGYHMKLEEM
jgi:GNAT superfamily N-acetyltransferase